MMTRNARGLDFVDTTSTEAQQPNAEVTGGIADAGSSSPPRDPIVARVRAMKLDKYESDLLDCVIDPTTISTTFDDVCLRDRDIIDTLRMGVIFPTLFSDAFKTGLLASQSGGGVLLYGPPGTGKTMLCRALANEGGVRMLQIQVDDIERRYVGETEQRVAAAFRLARRLGPCVIFLDELDALVCNREKLKDTYKRDTLSVLCNEIDGLHSSNANRDAGLIVVGATNRPQDLDSAIIRRLPNRFLIDLPGFAERKEILRRYLSEERYNPETVNIDKLAGMTGLFSGSDSRYLAQTAALAAFHDTIPTGANCLPTLPSRRE
ncbi:AAA-domain-containing protein [Mycena kentingensis (nom. inval.)]|nr:AAA-domain-containing protein [Mycena kentingensis (nom. inval.)]